MNSNKFKKLPYTSRVQMLASQPLLKVSKLPIGNNHLPCPLKLAEIVINTRDAQPSFPGRNFVKIRHGNNKKSISILDFDYFEPVK